MKVPTAWYVDVDWAGIRPPEVREIHLYSEQMVAPDRIIMGSIEVVKGRDWFDTREGAVDEACRRLKVIAQRAMRHLSFVESL